MDGVAREADDAPLRITLDPRLKLEFHGSKVTSDAGLLPFRDLDDALGLTNLAGEVIADTRTRADGATSTGPFSKPPVSHASHDPSWSSAGTRPPGSTGARPHQWRAPPKRLLCQVGRRLVEASQRPCRADLRFWPCLPEVQ